MFACFSQGVPEGAAASRKNCSQKASRGHDRRPVTPLLVRRGERSFERLYRGHVRDVYHYALAVLRNPADAEDVTQTTFMNAYRAYERGERPDRPRNWLIAI